MNIFERYLVQETRHWRYLFPGLMLILIAWVDFNVSQVILAPLLSLLCLIILALRLNHRTLIVWLFFYGAFVFFMLRRGLLQPDPLITEGAAIVRGATFCLSSIAVYWVCRQREALSESYQSLLKVVAHLPVPVLISDESGLLVFVNNRALEFLGQTDAQIREKTYFQFFGMPSNQGKFITSYLAFIEKTGEAAHDVVLASRASPGQSISAQWQAIYLGHQRMMITVILS